MQKIIIVKNKKKIAVNVVQCGDIRKVFGLMFRTRNTDVLLFDFAKPTRLKIHSLFVFFPFVAVWLDRGNKVIEMKTVKSFRLSVSCKKPFSKLVEIPCNDDNSRIIKALFSKNSNHRREIRNI